MLAEAGRRGLAPGTGGASRSLGCRAWVPRQLLVPAVLTLFFVFVRAPSWAGALTLAAVGMDLAFVHPTYALFVAIPLVGFLLVRARRGRSRTVLALPAYGVPRPPVLPWLEPLAVAPTGTH